MKLRDRIKSLRRVRASELLPNPRNWRTHPQAQKDALRGILDEVGIADAILARELPDGTLRIVDGHLRDSLDPEIEWPTLILDLTDEEELKLLASLDPLAAMAEVNAEKLGSLLNDIETENESIARVLEQLREEHPAESAGGDDDATSAVLEDSEKLKEFIKRRQQSVERGDDKAEVNFWVCLVFQSWNQKQDFLRQIAGVCVLYGMYADGEAFAEQVGLPVIPNMQRSIKSMLDRKLEALVAVNEGKMS